MWWLDVIDRNKVFFTRALHSDRVVCLLTSFKGIESHYYTYMKHFKYCLKAIIIRFWYDHLMKYYSDLIMHAIAVLSESIIIMLNILVSGFFFLFTSLHIFKKILKWKNNYGIYWLEKYFDYHLHVSTRYSWYTFIIIVAPIW